MKKDEHPEIAAGTAIRAALAAYRADAKASKKERPAGKRSLSSTQIHKKLTGADVNEGVVAFVLLNNLAGGSIGDVDLYRLLRAYLLDPAKRAAINAAAGIS